MQSFRDSKDRTWEISVNYTSAERIKKLTDVDVFGLVDDGLKPLAAMKPHQFVPILWALLQPKLEKANVSPEEFGESLVGDALQGGIDAFIEGLIDFFPQEQTRKSLRLLMVKSKQVGKLLMDQAEKELGELEPEKLAEQLRKALLSKSGNSGTSAPESFDLTPTRSLSVAS